MAIADIRRYFSDLSARASILLALQDQYPKLGIASLVKRINYGAGLAIADKS